MFRTVFFYIAFFPVTLFYALAINLFPKTATANSVRWSSFLFWAAGIRIEADLENIPKSGQFIFMVNHLSQLDIPALMIKLAQWQVGFIAKESLFTIPLFGRCMEHQGSIPVDRTNPRKAMKSINIAVKKIKAGQNIVIFPEGTRSTDFSQLQRFKTGGMILALKTGLPVIPIVIDGTGEALAKGSIRVSNKKTVRLRALPPIETQGRYTLKDRDAFGQDLHEIMSAAYTELRNGR
ncbi:1-acyl-sn-glycerol-3-phosphate acyltransferase [Desulfobaculum bizertense]|uniref:lysophospholipid acyltransferase family protein n=1 Tax=Desulfobaculum bizertense TaxID=376490 RepID=UPI001F16C64E|nr:lysophospholipid acyltransferase family protein [Desulfobaculum bizertense]UIJ37752.1 1-acyl-sn-glycerol-3-phosphate acyltransferase [Desulfobaculum bizertense]